MRGVLHLPLTRIASDPASQWERRHCAACGRMREKGRALFRTHELLLGIFSGNAQLVETVLQIIRQQRKAEKIGDTIAAVLGFCCRDRLVHLGGSIGSAANPSQRYQACQLIFIKAFKKFLQFLPCRVFRQVFEDRFAVYIVAINIGLRRPMLRF